MTVPLLLVLFFAWISRCFTEEDSALFQRGQMIHREGSDLANFGAFILTNLYLKGYNFLKKISLQIFFLTFKGRMVLEKNPSKRQIAVAWV